MLCVLENVFSEEPFLSDADNISWRWYDCHHIYVDVEMVRLSPHLCRCGDGTTITTFMSCGDGTTVTTFMSMWRWYDCHHIYVDVEMVRLSPHLCRCGDGTTVTTFMSMWRWYDYHHIYVDVEMVRLSPHLCRCGPTFNVFVGGATSTYIKHCFLCFLCDLFILAYGRLDICTIQFLCVAFCCFAWKPYRQSYS